MLTAIVVTLLVVALLAYALRSGGGLIAHRPYNNRHSDAAGARDDHLG